MRSLRRRVHSRLTAICGGYGALIIVFALVYWVIWLRSPDAFILNDQLNVFPLEAIQAFTMSGPPAITDQAADNLKDINQRVADSVSREQFATHRVSDLQQQIVAAKKESDDAYQALETARSAGYEAYKAGQLQPFQAEEDQLDAQSNGLQTLVDQADPVFKLALLKQLSDVKVHRSEVEIARLTELQRVIGEYLRDPNQYADRQLFDRSSQSYGTLLDLNRQLEQAQRDRLDTDAQVLEVLRQYRSERVGRLGFLDFLYFSLGVGTTTTFGDIIPNSTAARSAVTAQLLICLVVVGLFVNEAYRAFSSDRRASGDSIE